MCVLCRLTTLDDEQGNVGANWRSMQNAWPGRRLVFVNWTLMLRPSGVMAMLPDVGANWRSMQNAWQGSYLVLVEWTLVLRPSGVMATSHDLLVQPGS